MQRENILVKVSGDLFDRPEFVKWIGMRVHDVNVVVCVGGGTQIKEEFRRRGWKDDNYGPLGRETETPEQFEVARLILVGNKAKLEVLFEQAQIKATVVIPMINIGGVYCHVNGDQYILAAYLGFDRLHVATLAERTGTKNTQFRFLPKIQVTPF